MSGFEAEDRKSTWATKPEKKPSIALIYRRCTPVEQVSGAQILASGHLTRGRSLKSQCQHHDHLEYYVVTGAGKAKLPARFAATHSGRHGEVDNALPYKR